MTGTQEIVKRYITILDSELDDPNTARKASDLRWIYDDIPFAQIGSKYPRISVLSFGNPVEAHEVGTTRQRVTCRVEIQIRVKRVTWEKGVAGEMKYNAFLDDLGMKVIEAIRKPSSKSSLLTNEAVFHTQLEAENTIHEDDVLIKQLIYKNVFVR